MQKSPVRQITELLKKRTTLIAWIAGALIAVLVLISQLPPKTDKTQKTYLGKSKVRGVRNNNPGNIRYSPANAWLGKVPISQNTDGAFEQFVEWRYGVLALIKLLSKYIVRYGTISKMIAKYAPNTENNTVAYINAVSSETGYSANQVLTVTKETLKRLTLSIAKHELGSSEYLTEDDFNNAYQII